MNGSSTNLALHFSRIKLGGILVLAIGGDCFILKRVVLYRIGNEFPGPTGRINLRNFPTFPFPWFLSFSTGPVFHTKDSVPPPE